MARITVEDCIEQVPNRFELVLRAARRSRDIAHGAPEHVDIDRDKNPIIALREIALNLVDEDALKESLIQSMQRVHKREEPAEDELLAMLQNRARGGDLPDREGSGERPSPSSSDSRDTEEFANALFASSPKFEDIIEEDGD